MEQVTKMATNTIYNFLGGGIIATNWLSVRTGLQGISGTLTRQDSKFVIRLKFMKLSIYVFGYIREAMNIGLCSFYPRLVCCACWYEIAGSREFLMH